MGDRSSNNNKHTCWMQGIHSKNNLSPSDSKWPFVLKRRQFPISVCFAMTINKSQGQSLDNIGLYLPRPVFSHGQLYVAISRVTSRSSLWILIIDDDGERSSSTKNIVYKEIFTNLVQVNGRSYVC